MALSSRLWPQSASGGGEDDRTYLKLGIWL